MTGTDEDCLPSTTTNWDLFWRNYLIQDTVLGFKPKFNSLYINKLWSAVSNALLKSIIMRSVCFTIFKIVNNFCVKFTS